MSAFIDAHRDRFGAGADLSDHGRVGVRVLPASDRRSLTPQHADERLVAIIRSAHEANYGAYRVRSSMVFATACRSHAG